MWPLIATVLLKVRTFQGHRQSVTYTVAIFDLLNPNLDSD